MIVISLFVTTVFPIASFGNDFYGDSIYKIEAVEDFMKKAFT
jgi:hypothetical protein